MEKLKNMMKTTLLLSLISILGLSACIDQFGSGKLSTYYMYIDGDTGRTVDISYLQGNNNLENYKNEIVSEKVTLPFFKTVHALHTGKVPDNFLEVKSIHDSTTRAIIFTDDLQLADGKCGILASFLQENAVGNCAYYKDISKDSVLTYLKSINYPCYLEFSKDDTSKKIRLNDWYTNHK